MADKVDGIAAIAPVSPPERSGVSARPSIATQDKANSNKDADKSDKPTLEAAVKALDDHVSKLHPNVTFQVEHQGLGLVVVMIDSQDGTVLSVIPGDEARMLAKQLTSSDPASSDFTLLDQTA